MLFVFVFTIESTVVVCTPYPVLVRLVIRKLELVLYVRARIIELITTVYWVEPVVSDICPPNIIVTVEPKLVHVEAMVPELVDMLQDTEVDNVI